MNESGDAPYDHKGHSVTSESAEDGAKLKGTAQIDSPATPDLSNQIGECQALQHPMLGTQLQISLVQRQVDSGDSTLGIKNQILT